MLYDADGIRIEKTVGDSSEHYYYVDGLMVLGKKNSGNSLTYLYAGSEVIGSVSGNNRYDYLQDIQESITAILSHNGVSEAVYDYTDFGETSEIVADDTGNEICYTGAVYDKDTEEYYLNARYYDPDTAQFLSQDTYRGDVQTAYQWQLYAYCANNPINLIDPSGNNPLAPALATIGPAGWVAIGVIAVGTIYYYKEHTKNASPSKRNKHEIGRARKALDAGGEKGDKRRKGNPNPKKKKNHKKKKNR